MGTDQQLTYEDCAERLGLTVATLRQYRYIGHFPEPDEQVGRTPVWKPETVDRWDAERKASTDG